MMTVCFLIFGYSTFDAKSRGHHDGIKGIIATESSDKNFDDGMHKISAVSVVSRKVNPQNKKRKYLSR